MKILVTFAVRSEMRDWRGPAELTENIQVVLTGIGMRRTPDELRQALSRGVDICIASGLAGSLKREHRIGTITVNQIGTGRMQQKVEGMQVRNVVGQAIVL